MERILAGCREAPVPRPGSSIPDAFTRAVLDRFRTRVLHVFHHAGVLFDAVLSRLRAADWLRNGGGWTLDTHRIPRPRDCNRSCGPGRICNLFSSAELANT